MSVNRACKEAERESDGIPAKTIESWWKNAQLEASLEVVENSTTNTTPQNDKKKDAGHKTTDTGPAG